MSVSYQRPSAFDGAHLWTNMPPPYVGGGQLHGSHSFESQSMPQQQPHLHAFAPPQAFYPGFGTPFYAPLPADAYYAQQHQHQQPQSYSRHAFATPYAPAFGYDQFGIWRDNSREGRTGSTYSNTGSFGGQADHDHPSFDRPPHRATSNEAAPASAPVSQPQQAAPEVLSVDPATGHVEYNLIPNISAVPPPPSLERSAVPLADIATEMVWEACALGVAAENARSPSMPARWADSTKAPALFNEIDPVQEESMTSPRNYARSSPHTPELFGAIGDGRAPRKISHMSLDDGYGSDESSPSSSAPGTPADVPTVEAAAARRQRLAGLGLGFGYGATDSKGDYEEVLRNGLSSPVEAIRIQARKLGPQPIVAQAPASFPAEPTPAFRQFVKQVLTATLLAPEDLVLALYYVARIPAGSIIPPTQPEQGSGVSAQACAIKAAPFKVMLGALMLANKTLQDNSYRNETFAAVSGIPLKDVNELEAFVFGALGFDVAVREDVWRPWLDVVIERSRAGRGNTGSRVEVSTALQRLVQATTRQNATSTAPSSPVVVAIDRPSTPVNSASLIAEVNLDASGPLESPLRFDRNARYAVESPTRSSFGQDKKVASMFLTSHARSFGDEKRQLLQC
ncbi:hypothetical protein BCR35DRAFT_173168 [Leucosporidium creatinivorum]|uniref:Cyclin-domain-containing protein n=1 Tax=Leucosporidium creatinivorum TaxID=106004 RepID=A0A1Y2FYQ2_9BASI|nr:hypothetical protein BCR35DRAFT_173168 [Leucosporidium creatinivorum]